jgi:O-antigen/teichoic acid export membrane protein
MNQLGSKIKKGFVWDMFGSFISQASGFIVTIVLARLLGPEEFGLIAMAMVFIIISNAFVDVGFGKGLVQKQNIDNEHLNSVFLFNIVASFIISIIIFLSANLIGNFYNSPQVANIIKFLAIIPIIAAFGIVHQAILTRQMNFKALALRSTLSSIIGGIIGVTAAYYSQGVYSLIWKQISSTLVGAIAMWYGSKWLPNLKFNYSKLKELLSFTQYMLYDDLLKKFFERLNPLFIGKVFSPETLGFFSKAESLNLMVSDYTSKSIGKVMFPALSSVQDTPKTFTSIFLKIIAVSSASSVFLAGILYFIAAPFVLIVLGDQWEKTIPLFQILVFSTLISPHIIINSQAILSKGFSKTKFVINIYHRTLTVLPLIFGFFYGIEIFTAVLVICKFLVLIIYTIFSHLKLQINWWEQWKKILFTMLPLYVCIFLFHFFIPHIPDILKAVLFAVLYLSYLGIAKHESLVIFYSIISKYALKLKKQKD